MIRKTKSGKNGNNRGIIGHIFGETVRNKTTEDCSGVSCTVLDANLARKSP